MNRTRQEVRNQLRDLIRQAQENDVLLLTKVINQWVPSEADLDEIIEVVRYRSLRYSSSPTNVKPPEVPDTLPNPDIDRGAAKA